MCRALKTLSEIWFSCDVDNPGSATDGVGLLYGVVHSTTALAMGAAVLVFGTRGFVRLTPDTDELAEIRAGNVARAVVLAAVMIVLALLAEQGLETLLDALLPLPTLGRDLVAPS